MFSIVFSIGIGERIGECIGECSDECIGKCSGLCNFQDTVNSSSRTFFNIKQHQTGTFLNCKEYTMISLRKCDKKLKTLYPVQHSFLFFRLTYDFGRSGADDSRLTAKSFLIRFTTTPKFR